MRDLFAFAGENVYAASEISGPEFSIGVERERGDDVARQRRTLARVAEARQGELRGRVCGRIFMHLPDTSAAQQPEPIVNRHQAAARKLDGLRPTEILDRQQGARGCRRLVERQKLSVIFNDEKNAFVANQTGE
jgi:hypothetical protein